MPSSIKPEDKPVIVLVDMATNPTSYAVTDVKGVERGRFYEQDDANEFALFANSPEVTLMQSNMRGTGVERGSKRRAQPKGKTMPRGIPKKKRAKKAVKKAAVVKKTAKKTMKRRKRRV